MQRLFSTFPGGMPGVALLLLRVVLGGMSLAVCARSLAASDGGGWRAVISGVLAGASGSALLAGLLTPFAAVVGVIAIAVGPHSWGSGTSLLPGNVAMMLVVAIGIALALLGPGAFSLDSRLFGRREMSFPPDPEGKER